MILIFPNLDTFRLALTAGALPPAVTLAPARAAIDPAGPIIVEPSVPVDNAFLEELGHLGVQGTQASPVPLNRNVICLPQLLPLEQDRWQELQLENMPILFDVAHERQLPELVGEILRLGNDRQSFRWIDCAGAKRALLRVTGPPYYSLLRALDAPDEPGSTFAYRELSPRVWVQLGWTHPLIEQIQAPPRQILLMRRPHHWSTIEEDRFRDIYEVLDFTLPSTEGEQIGWHEVESPARIQVPVRLARAGNVDQAELWVVREDALRQVDELVRNADDHLLARLAFAVTEKDGRHMIVLRVRPAKPAPPVLVLNAIGFRPYLGLSHLFVPCGRRLHPPLRRDAVAKLLIGDVKRITWLYPESDDGFVPQSLPDESFQPLQQWVEYILDRDHEALTAWTQAHRFEFEAFICADDNPAPKKPRPKDDPKTRAGDKGDSDDLATVAEPSIQVKDKSRRKKTELADYQPAVIEPSRLEQELLSVEKEFGQLQGPLDSADRQALWPELTRLNAALGHADDAAICCGNALWESDVPAGPWLAGCRQNDAAPSAWKQLKNAPAGQVLPEILGPMLSADILKPADVRYIALTVIECANEDGRAAELVPLLGPIQRQLERHERLLGVRLAWLAWEAVHRLAQGDVLSLARARDRLLERLFVQGLSVDLDLPGFLRVGGAMTSDRHRQVCDHLKRLRPMVHDWLGQGTLLSPGTKVYADLMFAFAFGRLGETTLRQTIMHDAPAALPQRDEVHGWLMQAFEFRILEAQGGKTGREGLPAELLQRLDAAERVAHYKIDRLREHSRILEPHERIDPYRRWFGSFADDLSRELALLFDVDDRTKLTNKLNRLLSPRDKKRPVEPRVLATALELSPRLGESFARNLLYQVERALDKITDAVNHAIVLEKSLILAAHFDMKEEVQDLVERFHGFLAGAGSDLAAENLETLIGGSFRSLRKLGLRDEAGRLLERMAQLIQQKGMAKTAAGEGRGKELRLLLQVASGWLYFGDIDSARTVLDSVRAVLFEGSLLPIDQTHLVCAYLGALGQAPLDLVQQRTIELFRKLGPVHDTFTVNSHYSLSRLDVVEAALLALVNDDVAVSPEARRWLDDDEFLVRRRIHRSVRTAMNKAGL